MSADPLPGAEPGSLRVERVVIWRHGRTMWNATGRFQGQSDPPLDEVGRRQARHAAAYLAADPAELILSSDLSRALGTAAAITDLVDAPLRVEPRLREIHLGTWEGMTRDELIAKHPEQFEDWISGRPVSGRGGESRTQVRTRVLAALREVAVSSVLLVTHGGASRVLLNTLLGLGPSHTRMLDGLGNCHWSELVRRPSGWVLRGHNLRAASDALSPGSDRPESRSDDADAMDAEESPAEESPAQESPAGGSSGRGSLGRGSLGR